MCDPMTLAVSSFMVGTVQAVSSYGAASQQAQAQNDLYAANKVSAENASIYEHQSLAMRRVQEDQASGAKLFDNALETKSKEARAETAAGEAGISGLSVDSLISDIWGASDRTAGRISDNRDMTLTQLNAEDQSVEARKTDRTNSVRKGVAPSMLSLGLNIASNGLNAGTSYRKMTK